MKNTLVSTLVVALTVSGSPAFAQEAPPEKETVQTVTEPFSKGLTLVGAVLALASFGVMFHPGKTHRILGDYYCVDVSPYTYSVDYGPCTTSALEKKIGMGMLGTGALFMYIGSRQVTKNVTVSPTKTGAGVQATVRF